MIVIDANGLYIEAYDPDGNTVAGLAPMTPAHGMRWLALQNIQPGQRLDLETGSLWDDGFVREDA